MIFPEITRKQLGQCKAGELIRLEWGRDQPYALVATGEEGQFLVFLSTVGEARPPRIALLQRPDWSAIGYGSTYRVEVDQSADHVDLAGHRLWEKNGALFFTHDHYVMRLSPLPHSKLFGTWYLELDTATLVSQPTGGVAIFGRWSIMLPKGGDRYETVLTIE